MAEPAVFDQRVLCPRVCFVDDDHLGPCLRLLIYPNWYRSLPYSSLRRLRVRFDGEAVPDAGIRARIDDRLLRVETLARLVASSWFVRDPLPLLIARTERMTPGLHRIEISYEMRITDLAFGDLVVIEPAQAEREVMLR